MKKSELPLYQPPWARDLSASSVSGHGPLGVCWPGTTPYENCVTGDIFIEDGSCAPGTIPGPEPPGCRTGPAPGGDKCTSGSIAYVDCYAGSQA